MRSTVHLINTDIFFKGTVQRKLTEVENDIN
jgi:hypothetical protein